jgi:glucose-1-phosphate adenylyltransferase
MMIARSIEAICLTASSIDCANGFTTARWAESRPNTRGRHDRNMPPCRLERGGKIKAAALVEPSPRPYDLPARRFRIGCEPDAREIMKDVLALVLGGGRGTRLYPLTKYRSKPAVPLAGKYRLIDIPLSNCINSGINRVYVLTQFNSVSLHRHIRRTYTFDQFRGGFVEILAAQQTLGSFQWYQGTADAVRQNIRYLQEADIRYVLVLSGDQLYHMDYRQMLHTHRQSGADVTIATLPVSRRQAPGLGIMRIDASGRVVGFLEKPKTNEEIDLIRTEPDWIDRLGIPSLGRECLASMGIYLFNRETLIDVLTKTNYADFGKEIFPASIRARHVQAYLFDGYWEDIGTIRSFYEANLQLAQPRPPFVLQSPEAPIYTHSRFLPPSRIEGAAVTRSLIADGCQIGAGAVIENSVVGLRCRIGANVVIRNSVLMGADEYQSNDALAADRAAGRPPVGIDDGALIDGAIIDKNCRIGRKVEVLNRHKEERREENDGVMIADSIVVVEKGTTLADNWRLE